MNTANIYADTRYSVGKYLNMKLYILLQTLGRKLWLGFKDSVFSVKPAVFIFTTLSDRLWNPFSFLFKGFVYSLRGRKVASLCEADHSLADFVEN